MPLVYLDVDCRLRFCQPCPGAKWSKVGDNAGRHVSEVRGEAIWLEQNLTTTGTGTRAPFQLSRLVRIGIVGGPRWMRTSYFRTDDLTSGRVVSIYTLSTDVMELTLDAGKDCA